MGSNELFQLAYVDPTTQVRTTCSDMCFMANSPNVTFQDFTVENAINTTGVRIEIHSWYGSGGGLGNVQIYQAGKYKYYAKNRLLVKSSSYCFFYD